MNRPKKRGTPHAPEGSCDYSLGQVAVRGRMNRCHLGTFQEALDALVEDGMAVTEVDFSECRYLSSLFIGCLVDAILRAREAGKSVHVRVSPEIGKFFETAHLYEIFAYEVVEVRSASGIGSAV